MRIPELVTAVRNFRYLPHVAIAGGVLICAAVGYYAFGSKTPEHRTANGQGYSENSYCRVVSFNESAKNGTAGPCLRCVTGTYTATRWTNCPVRESANQPGSVECGYNAGQTPTAIDPATMCAKADGEVQSAANNVEPPPYAAPDTAGIEQPPPASSDSGGTSTPSGGIVITGPPRGVPNAPGTSGGVTIGGPPRGVANVPGSGSSGNTAVVTTVGPSSPPVRSVDLNAGASYGGSATTGGGYLAILLPRGQHKPAKVLSVTPGGAAAYWGIEPGDIILSIQGSPVRYGQDVLDLLARHRPGERVQIVVLRRGGTYSVDVVLGEQPASNAWAPPSNGGGDPGGGPVEIKNKTLQPEQRDTSGRIVREAANIYVVGCNGQGFYIYEYLNRPGYRAIRPPDWSHPVGGRDFDTFEDAVHVACE